MVSVAVVVAVTVGVAVVTVLATVAVWLGSKVGAMKRVAAPFPQLPDGQGKVLFRQLREDAFERHVAAAGGKLTFVIDSLVTTIDPAFIRTLLLSRAHSLGRSWLYRAVSWGMPYSDGVLFMAHDDWRRRHDAFTPIFAGANIRHYTLAMFEGAYLEASAVQVKADILATAQAAVVAAWAAAGGRRTPAFTAALGDICAAGDAALAARYDTLRAAGGGCFADMNRRLQVAEDDAANTVAPRPDGAPQLYLRRRRLASPVTLPGVPDLDYNYTGPSSELDLLTASRWMAIRVLFSYGFGLNAAGGHLGSATPTPTPPQQVVAATLARTLDDYARTALERMPHATSPPAVAWLYQYARLWRLAFRIRSACGALLTLAGTEAERPLAAGADIMTQRMHVDNRSTGRRQLAAPAAPAAPAVAAPAAADAPAADAPAPAAAPAAAKPEMPQNFVTAMISAGFTLDEVTSEANHVHGAHKAVAFTTAATIFELSLPANAGVRAAVVAEFERVCGRPAPGTPLADVIRQAWSALATTPSPPPTVLGAPSGAAAAAAPPAFPPPLDSLPAGWRPPERADLEYKTLPVTNRVWKETLRLHVVSLGTLRVYVLGAAGGGTIVQDACPSLHPTTPPIDRVAQDGGGDQGARHGGDAAGGDGRAAAAARAAHARGVLGARRTRV